MRLKKIDRVFAIHSLDVWGNARDGYEVNEKYLTGNYIVADEFPRFEVTVKVLKKAGLIRPRIRALKSQYPYDSIEVVEYKGKPVYIIEEITEYQKEELERSYFFDHYPQPEAARVWKIGQKKISRANRRRIHA